MWKDLSILDKSRIIQLAVQNGITSLSKIQQLYDSSLSQQNNTVNTIPNNDINTFNSGGKIYIKHYVLEGKKYYKNGGVLEGDFDIDNLSINEIIELNKLGYTVEIL